MGRFQVTGDMSPTNLFVKPCRWLVPTNIILPTSTVSYPAATSECKNVAEVSGIAPGFWGWGQIVGYAVIALITVFGFYLKKINVQNVVGFSIASSLLFFFLSNSSYFFFENNVYHTYATSFSGYMDCLAAGIPFLKNNIPADLVYSGVFFGGYALLKEYAFKKAVA